MSIERPNFFHAAIRIHGGNPPTVAVALGCGSLGRTGLGVYTLKLDVPLDPANSTVESSVTGGTGGTVQVVDTDDTTKTLNIFDKTGAAADLDCCVNWYNLTG